MWCLHYGLRDSWGEGGEGPSQVLGHLSGLTQCLEGPLGKAEGLEDRCRGWGLAQVLLLALDGLLDAQQHGGQPLVQPGDGVELLHLWHTRNGDYGDRWLVPRLALAPCLSQP